jgi:hypothetical protein
VAVLEHDARRYDRPERGERFARLRALGRRGPKLSAADPDIARLQEKNA